MLCPKCSSNKIRESEKLTAADLVAKAQGKIAFRCRDCRHRFHHDAPPGMTLAGKADRIIHSHRDRARFKNRAKLIGGQLALYGGGLLVFFLFLRFVAVRE